MNAERAGIAGRNIRAPRLLAWLLGAVAGAWVLAHNLRIDPDITRFAAAEGSRWQRDIAHRLQNGPAGRLVIFAVSAGSQHATVRASTALAAHLIDSGQFVTVQNGDVGLLRREYEPLFPYRYLLSDRVLEARFSTAELHRSLLAAAPLVQGSAGWILSELLPADPTLESLHIARQWAGSERLPYAGGVWFNKEHAQAVLLAFTRGQGNDFAAQSEATTAIERAIEAVRSTLDLTAAQLEFSGLGLLSAQARSSAQQSVNRLKWISAALVLAILFAGYRRAMPVVVSALPVLLGIGAGLAATTIVFGDVNVLALAFACVLIGEAVDYPSYLLTQSRKGTVLADEATRVWPTLRLAIATSVVSLAVLLLADFRGLQQLGLLCGTGLLVAGMATRWLLPDLFGSRYRATWQAPRFMQSTSWPTRTGARDAIDRDRTRVAAAAISVSVPLFSIISLTMATPLWNDQITAINPLPVSVIEQDQRLRNMAGLPGIQSLLVMRAGDPQAILEAQEATADSLSRMHETNRFGGVDYAAKYLPSGATQLRRRSALPERADLQRALAAAAIDTPFNDAAFLPFVEAVVQSKSLSLDLNALPSGVLSLRAQGLLFRTETQWVGLIIVPASVPQAVIDDAVRAALAGRDVTADWVNPAEELSRVIERARTRLSVLFAIGFVATFLVVAADRRSFAKATRVLLPVAVALAASAAVVRFDFGPLTVFNLLALVLVLGISTNYSLFLQQGAATDGTTDADGQMLFSLGMTSATTLAVFGALAFSGIGVVESIGRTVVVGIAVSLVWLLFNRWAHAVTVPSNMRA